MSNLRKGRQENFRQLISEQVLASLTHWSLVMSNLHVRRQETTQFLIYDWPSLNHS
jgi:hypothetical protein